MRRILFAVAMAAALFSRAAFAQATGPITLPEAHRLADERNAELQLARLEIEAARGALLQAGVRPNPELGLLAEDQRSATRTTTIQLNQPIELGGKRTARIEVAQRSVEQAEAALAAKRAEIRARVSLGFFEAQAAQEQVALLDGLLKLADASRQAAARRVEAGKVPPLEQSKAQLALSGARVELAQARGEFQVALQRLAAFWGESQTVVPATGSSPMALPGLPSADRLETLLPSAPVVRQAELELSRRQALVELEQARRVPDVTLSLGAKRANDMDRTQAVLGISVPLPLFDRNQGGILESMKRRNQAEEALRAAQLTTRLEVRQAQQRLGLALEQARLLQDEALPVARQAYTSALQGYEAGKFSFLEALDAQRSLFQTQQTALRQRAEAYRASADLERLLGAPAQDTPSPN